ncbi:MULTISPECIES: Spy/CpxP family protein refolding chaperone [unclassified Roseateles]|uniref:Spy/CpxP family protein refolding chaperone n=1 Tax=unclassified Roseateles TaxID=2626991 RepID=UPI0006FB8645|nr:MULTISPECIES: hypothetical protein [unclassified Roseateles]KQW51198.1 hypothetical protein ASC81_00645 [Pelomonas sp. Root405]KRA77430.1 hypothetical protein ASD88_00645 [Pelomonas sp. Root662]
MNPFLKNALGAVALAIAAPSFSQASPYAGEQDGPIKALSSADVTALRQGQGMGLAKAAELNGYPGPLHTLELAEQLRLTPEQVSATRQLMDAHKARARALGDALVAAEMALDRLFAERSATLSGVDEATQQIAKLQAKLRAEHLATHLIQTALLSGDQAQRYAALRGYGSGGHGDRPAAGHHH